MQIRYETNICKFNLIPGQPIAYWAGNLFDVFRNNKNFNNVSIARAGLSTGDNDKYLKFWSEIDFSNCGFNYKSNSEYLLSKKTYVPVNKGGEFRRWYGNNEYVIDWRNPNKFHRPRTTYMNLYFKPALTWTVLTSGKFCSRFYGDGFLFDHAAASLFPNNSEDCSYLLGFMNTNSFDYILNLINPTLNTGADVVLKMPLINISEDIVNNIKNTSIENVSLCKKDWDSFETSWDFKKHPLI